ncbi:MAG: peptidylprolyl isomerase [Candidatus Krumholzibacteria bacterium]|nr:peptidylprolyl isomerase [Candidatus Krumholzibacteria bacterium]
MIKRIIVGSITGVSLLAVTLSLTGAGCERMTDRQRTDSSPVVVKVNGESLTKREFDFFLPEEYRSFLTTEELQEYLDRWITTQLLYEEGMKSGMIASSDIESRLEQYRKDLIADHLVQNVIQDKAMVSDDEVRGYYDGHAQEYLTEFRVSHILVNTLEDAEQVKQQIGQRSFAYLARRYSIDKHSGSGGDLGYLSKGNMIPEFEDIVFGMKLGDVSDIIESEFGYHIIKIVDIREARVKLEFEDVQDEIANNLMLRKREAVYDSLVATLRARADIEIMDSARELGVASAMDSVAINP